jgi:hypothetical protein
MLRKLLSVGALVVVALALGAGPAAAKRNPGPPNNPGNAPAQTGGFSQDGFSDGRFMGGFGQDGFSDGRFG